MRIDNFQSQIGPVTVGDGAIGTMLQAAGLSLGEVPERWNLERPDEVAAVHQAYAAAGAQWTTANTFGANGGRLALIGWTGRVRELNAAAVRLAREGAPGLPVLGSIGPTTTEPSAWTRLYEEQVRALAAAGVDALLVETIVSLPEGLTAVRAAAAAGTGPVVASFTTDPDGMLLDGTSPEDAAEALVKAGAAAVGVNCGAGPEVLLGAARRLARADIAPVLAAPNAGLPTIERGNAVYPWEPDPYSQAAIQLLDSGVRMFAGCCGTTPAHIEAVARLMSAREGRNRPCSNDC